VPVRVHDQCFTSEVFGSQRWVSYSHILWERSRRAKQINDSRL
jgi:GTP cyclohydrolase II